MKTPKKPVLYVPAVNPLPKVIPVRGYVTRTGKVVAPHRAKPPFRHNILPR